VELPVTGLLVILLTDHLSLATHGAGGVVGANLTNVHRREPKEREKAVPQCFPERKALAQRGLLAELLAGVIP